MISHYCLCSLCSLRSQRMADIDSFIAKHLQGELDASILGFAYTSVSQFLNQFRLTFLLRKRHEIKRSVLQLLSHAMTSEALHNTLIGCIRTEEKILLLIIVSRSTQLHMLAVIIIHLLVLNIILSIVLNLVYFLNHNLN